MQQLHRKQSTTLKKRIRSPIPMATALSDPVEEAERPFQTGAADVLDADLRHRMISEAAYYLYRQRGCAEGYELDDWLQAEAQIDRTSPEQSREGEVR